MRKTQENPSQGQEKGLLDLENAIYTSKITTLSESTMFFSFEHFKMLVT